MILILVLLFEVVLLTIGNESKESSTAVAATTAATSWARSKSTSSCRAARGETGAYQCQDGNLGLRKEKNCQVDWLEIT